MMFAAMVCEKCHKLTKSTYWINIFNWYNYVLYFLLKFIDCCNIYSTESVLVVMGKFLFSFTRWGCHKKVYKFYPNRQTSGQPMISDMWVRVLKFNQCQINKTIQILGTVLFFHFYFSYRGKENNLFQFLTFKLTILVLKCLYIFFKLIGNQRPPECEVHRRVSSENPGILGACGLRWVLRAQAFHSERGRGAGKRLHRSVWLQ